jgi:hypothetical protein
MGFREMFHTGGETSGTAGKSNQFRQCFPGGDVDDFLWVSPLWIPIVAIIGGITLAIVKSISVGRVRELEVRERIAMIEKGLVPPPESNPRGFERAMDAMDGMKKARREDSYERYLYRRHRGAERHRSAGIMLTGIGFGLMLMLTLATRSPGTGIGIGGFLVLLGVAFFVNSVLERRDIGPRGAAWPGPPPPPGSPLPPDADA